MSTNSTSEKKSISADWLVQGALTKLGDTFDRLTGRGWKPSSSLATSELIERLKKLLDNEAREGNDKRVFVPHNIKLKMQWDKFSTDSDDSLKKLETELLTAAVDHINDKRYYTHAPLAIEVKPDYFTDGVKLFVSFEKHTGEEHEAELNVTIPAMKMGQLVPEPIPEAEPLIEKVVFRFTSNGNEIEKILTFQNGRRFSVGRTKENDLTIDDSSVSKFHASLLLNADGKVVVADTGSTNGTFVDDERISYGKAHEIGASNKVRFGQVDVRLEIMPKLVDQPDVEQTGSYLENNLPDTEAAIDYEDALKRPARVGE